MAYFSCCGFSFPILNYPGHTLSFLVIYLLWFSVQPITLALVYVGTTLKDLSDVTHGWHDFSKARWVCTISSLVHPVFCEAQVQCTIVFFFCDLNESIVHQTAYMVDVFHDMKSPKPFSFLFH